MDRTVHASHPAGEEIVRYNRAGKWYRELVEPSPHAPMRAKLTLAQAAQEAIEMACQGGKIHLDRYGGQRFDSEVRRRMRLLDDGDLTLVETRIDSWRAR